MSSYPAPSEAGFLDTVDHRYSLAIDLLQDESIIRGYGDRRFLPENTLNRAEFLKMIVVSKYAENYYIGKGEQRCFEDVFEDQWFSDYVCFAKEQGIVSGYNNETFRPSQEVNFVEGVKILMQSYKYEIDPYDMGGQWYEKYIAAANADKILPQEVEYYDQTITRGIFAEMLARVLAHKTGKMIGSQTYGQYVLSKAIPVIQERGIENTLPMEFSYNGNDATMLLDTRYYDMEIVLGNNIYRVKEGEECKKTTHCPMESQAESFSSFQKRLDADVIINGGYFEAYSQSLDGNNWHTV
ncbi:MAG: S-layer homology domain-containing protein [Patescibacteria group bacterium]|nr:S-layer homology domain-containing protein [Patescibacteria group bacterium]